MTQNPLLALIQDSKVIICVGSGGVGKTTTASALGFLAAELGKKVLVLTIDPSKRLKSTLGIADDLDIAEIKDSRFKGSLSAAVVDNKKTFDDFVRRAAKYAPGAENILKNKLYIQMSTTLSGSQEFTALEKLHSAVESQLYDLVILDTPPAKHAMDFLEAPQKLAILFQESIVKWFRDPTGKGKNILARLLQTGTQQVLKALEFLTGSDFMRELADFFKNINLWQARLENRVLEVQRLLVDSKTKFVLVTALDEARLLEARQFARDIEKSGCRLEGIIVNRAEPSWWASALGETDLENNARKYFAQRLELLAKVETWGPWIVKIPELRDNISDLETVSALARLLGESK